MAHPITLPAPHDHGSRPATARPQATGLVAVVKAWHARWRYRRTIDRLPDHLLRDIGLSRSEARREAVKPFWRE